MKKILLLCFATFLCAKAFAEYTFSIEPQGYFAYRFHCNYFAHTSIASATAHFEQFNLKVHTPNAPYIPETIHKPAGVVRAYSFENPEGAYIEGSSTVLSLGTFLDSMKEIYVYNHQSEKYLGYFAGIWDTENIAEFVFYDIYSQPLAVASVDGERYSIPIMDFQNRDTQIAIFEKHHNRFSDGSVEYYWEMRVLKDEAIPPEVLQIFAAFVTDIYFSPHPSLFTGFRFGL